MPVACEHLKRFERTGATAVTGEPWRRSLSSAAARTDTPRTSATKTPTAPLGGRRRLRITPGRLLRRLGERRLLKRNRGLREGAAIHRGPGLQGDCRLAENDSLEVRVGREGGLA